MEIQMDTPIETGTTPHPTRPTHPPRPATARLTLLVALAIPWLLAAPGAAQAPPPSCADVPARQALDFWVGDWRVVTSEGQQVGTNRIEKLHGGCLIEENWTSAGDGSSGQSMNFLDPATGRWTQVWVGAEGSVVRYSGAVEGGVLRYVGEEVRPDGGRLAGRATLTPMDDGRLRHVIERSDDGTAWRVVFDAIYEPMAAGEATAAAPAPVAPSAAPETPGAALATGAAPSPAAPPAPAALATPAEPSAPQPSETQRGAVVARSGAAPEADLAPTQLQSPLVLEVPIGPVESVPRGYSWSTSETGRFTAEGATVRRLTFTREERRGRVDLVVVVTLYADGFLSHGALDLTLLDAGTEIATAGVGEFAMGRSVGSQSSGQGIEKRVVFELDRETFERIFDGGDERPILRIVLTVTD